MVGLISGRQDQGIGPTTERRNEETKTVIGSTTTNSL